MAVLRWQLRCGRRGVLLALVLQGRSGGTPLDDALVTEGGCRFAVRWLDLVDLGRGQRGNVGLGTTEPDGAIENARVELQVALESLW